MPQTPVLSLSLGEFEAHQEGSASWAVGDRGEDRPRVPDAQPWGHSAAKGRAQGLAMVRLASPPRFSGESSRVKMSRKKCLGQEARAALLAGEPQGSWACRHLSLRLVLPRTSLQTQAQPATSLALDTWTPAERPWQSWPPFRPRQETLDAGLESKVKRAGARGPVPGTPLRAARSWVHGHLPQA